MILNSSFINHLKEKISIANKGVGIRRLYNFYLPRFTLTLIGETFANFANGGPIRESLSREIFPKWPFAKVYLAKCLQNFPQFFFYEKKNNDGKRCFLYKNKVYKNRRKEKSYKYCKES